MAKKKRLRLTQSGRGTCDERLKPQDEGSTYRGYTGYTGFREGLEHLKIETKLINERFASVMGECVPSLPYSGVCYDHVSFLIPNPQHTVSLYTFAFRINAAWSGGKR